MSIANVQATYHFVVGISVVIQNDFGTLFGMAYYQSIEVIVCTTFTLFRSVPTTTSRIAQTKICHPIHANPPSLGPTPALFYESTRKHPCVPGLFGLHIDLAHAGSAAIHPASNMILIETLFLGTAVYTETYVNAIQSLDHFLKQVGPTYGDKYL